MGEIFDNVCKYLSRELEPCGMRLSIGLGGIDGIVKVLSNDYVLKVCADETVACKHCPHYRLLTEKSETSLAGKFGEY